MRVGIEVIIITGRKSEVVAHRAKVLGIQEVYQGIKDKGVLCKELMKKKGLGKDQLCCMGDDLPDLPLFHLAGLDQLGGLLPVGDMQEVGILGRAAGFKRWTATFDTTDIAFRTERVGETPTHGRTLARI